MLSYKNFDSELLCNACQESKTRLTPIKFTAHISFVVLFPKRLIANVYAQTSSQHFQSLSSTKSWPESWLSAASFLFCEFVIFQAIAWSCWLSLQHHYSHYECYWLRKLVFLHLWPKNPDGKILQPFSSKKIALKTNATSSPFQLIWSVWGRESALALGSGRE